MDKGRTAEWLLTHLGGHRRAEEVIGDLLECSSAKGSPSFWWPVFRLLLALCWADLLAMVSAPLSIAGVTMLTFKVFIPYFLRYADHYTRDVPMPLSHSFLPMSGRIAVLCWMIAAVLWPATALILIRSRSFRSSIHAVLLSSLLTASAASCGHPKWIFLLCCLSVGECAFFCLRASRSDLLALFGVGAIFAAGLTLLIRTVAALTREFAQHSMPTEQIACALSTLFCGALVAMSLLGVILLRRLERQPWIGRSRSAELP